MWCELKLTCTVTRHIAKKSFITTILVSFNCRHIWENGMDSVQLSLCPAEDAEDAFAPSFFLSWQFVCEEHYPESLFVGWYVYEVKRVGCFCKIVRYPPEHLTTLAAHQARQTLEQSMTSSRVCNEISRKKTAPIRTMTILSNGKLCLLRRWACEQLMQCVLWFNCLSLCSLVNTSHSLLFVLSFVRSLTVKSNPPGYGFCLQGGAPVFVSEVHQGQLFAKYTFLFCSVR